MSKTLSITNDFPHASLSVKEFLMQMQADIFELKISSAEAFNKIKKKVIDSYNRWPEIVDSYKASISDMPKALRRRDFIKKSIVDIESCERELKRFMAEIREISFQDFRESLDKRLKGVDVKIKILQMHFKDLSQQIDELQEQSLVQKFLHGERVMSARENIQWRRKMFHCFSGLFFFYLFVYTGLSKTFLHVLGWSFALFAISVETMRHLKPWINDWCCWIFEPLMREREKTKINSAVFYIVSMWLVYLVFPIEVSMLAILFIAIGDPIAGIVGTYWGKTKLKPHVSLEGSIACAVSCAMITFVCAGFLFQNTLSLLPLIFCSLIGGLIGAFAESSFKKLDDNLVMPLLSAPFLWVLMMVFGVV